MCFGVQFPGEPLSLAELSAACLDGDLVAVGEGFLPADAVETPWVRAASLWPLVSGGQALVGLSAAWVHGACVEPIRHHLRRTAVGRRRHPETRRVVYHDLRLPAADVIALGAVSVASVSRTIRDLACVAAPTEQAVAHRLAIEHPTDARAAHRTLRAAGPVRGKPTGLASLTRWGFDSAQALVTR